jgi:hypothetical protein
MSPNPSQIAALALTLADRYPLLNTMGETERARVRESLRRLRLTLATRVECDPHPAPRTIPGGSDLGGKRPPRTTTPTREGSLSKTCLTGERVDVPRERVNEAGLISRNAYRGVGANPSAKHDATCPWAKELWPLGPTGDVILCSCGVCDRLDGPIAAKVNGILWSHWARLEQEAVATLLRREQREWRTKPSDKRRSILRAMKRSGKPIPSWMQAASPPASPTAEDWGTVLARLRAALS